MDARKGTQQARRLRRDMTDAERYLWQHLRGWQIGDHKFRRQFSVPPYILDFACLEQRLAIELDGGPHAEQADYDAQRTAYLERQGWRVLRFWNDQVLQQLDDVLAAIWGALAVRKPRHAEATPSPQPSPACGRGGRVVVDYYVNVKSSVVRPPLPQAGEGWGEDGGHCMPVPQE